MKKTLSVLVCVILLGTWSAPRGMAQNNGSDIRDVRVSMPSKDISFQALSAHLQFHYGISIGFETSARNLNEPEYYFETTPVNEVDMSGPADFSCKRGHKCLAIEVKDAKLAEILDLIVPQMKGYQWEINDGIVNIFPSSDRNPEFERLLSVKIKSFQVKKGTTLLDVRKAILMTPEVSAHLEEFELANRIQLDSVTTRMRKAFLALPENFEVSDVTLRQLLNRLARVKQSGWSLHTIRNGLNNIELSL